MNHSLRHLRVFLAIADTGSATKAASACHVTQPAVTQALAKIEAAAGQPLFARTPHGLFPTPSGQMLARRLRRAFGFLDPALGDLAPRLTLTATLHQLEALAAVCETENFTLAALRLGIAQPTVHRAVAQLEREAGRPLFERSAHGMIASRPALLLAHAAELAFAELAQADADLAEAIAGEAGRIVIGAMPLSRAYVLPRAISAFRSVRPNLPIQVLEGPYADLLAGLRRGAIDFLIGALRNPPPIGDIDQVPLFADTLVLVAGRHHPLVGKQSPDLEDLARFPWVVARSGTPIRQHFDALFAPLGDRAPKSIVESGSLILMRELLAVSDHLGCISYLQAQAEIARGLLTALPVDLAHTTRPIGLTLRAGWVPTAAQRQFIDCLSGPDAGPET